MTLQLNAQATKHKFVHFCIAESRSLIGYIQIDDIVGKIKINMEGGIMEYLLKETSGSRAVSIESKLLSQRDIYIEGEISSEVSIQVLKQLTILLRDSDDPIRVWISSEGGDLNAALSITRLIRSMDGKVRILTIGYDKVYRAAAYILSSSQPGRRLCIGDTSIMLNLNQTQIKGFANTHDEHMTYIYQKARDNILDETGKDNNEIDYISTHERYMSVEEAKSYGFIDRKVNYYDIVYGREGS